MSFDGFVTRSVTLELNEKIVGGKIDKVYQPERDEIVLSIRTHKGNMRLLLSASASNPRIHLTKIQRENPMTPPMLCMLIRKHLCGGIITGVFQKDFDRLIKIEIESRNELGDICVKSLIIEIMGRHSNIILIDDTNKILDSAKHIDFTVSQVRQILPGLIYESAPSQEKLSANNMSLQDLMTEAEKALNDELLDKFLVSSITGMSPLLAREIVYRFYGHTKLTKGETDIAKFVVFATDFLKKLKDNNFVPTLVTDNVEKKPIAFSCVELLQYENGSLIERGSSISEVIEGFYEKRSNRDNMNRRATTLIKLVCNNIERCEKKLAIHRENLEQSKDREKFKMYGDLLTANMYRVKYGMKSVVVENFYDENKELEIPLKEDVSPSGNAQRYYKKYTKAKTTEQYAKEQIKFAEQEKIYLESVLETLENVETPQEIEEIRFELSSEGYLPKFNTKKKQQKKLEPIKYISDDGYEILVGRNNRQNDELTLKKAYSTDIWLHTKNIPGSHTIIRTRGEKEVPDTTLMQAAKIAAYHSKGKNSSNVPVDYTSVKNVKKPNGAKAGMVIYDKYNTVYVLPQIPEKSNSLD